MRDRETARKSPILRATSGLALCPSPETASLGRGTAAIQCAHAIADAAALMGLQVRAGLHTGECDVLGEKIGGVAVELSEAIAGCARRGEVLISHTIKDLVAGSGIEFETASTQSFENLPDRWRLFTVMRGAEG